MASKIILVFLGLVSLMLGGWAGVTAFADTTLPISALGMMGMMGYLFHSAVIFTSLTFPVQVRRVLTLLLLCWHVPETILIATLGMGIPADEQSVGVGIHTGFSVLALVSWYLAKPAEESDVVQEGVPVSSG